MQQKGITYPKVGLKDVLRYFWQGIKPKKWLLFILVFCIAFYNLIYIIAPLFYKRFFDIIFNSNGSTAVAPDLLKIIIYVGMLHILAWGLSRFAEFCNNYFQPMTMARLKQISYNYLIEHSYSFFASNFVGSLVQRVNRFGRAFERLSDNLIWNILPLFVRIASVLVIVFFVNRWIDLIILIWILIFISFNVVFSKWKLKWDIEAAAIDSKATGYLADTITNQNSIALFTGLKREKSGYKKVTVEQAKMTLFTWNLDATINAVQSALSFGIEFLLFFFAIKYWGSGLITVGVFVLLQSYAGNLIDQLWGFTRIVRDTYQAYADAKEMVEILSLPHEIKDIPAAKELSVSKGEIEFKNLMFSFDETRKVLENINLVIKPGEKVALVGPSGAGKTTFVRLLLRLYSPTSGKVLIDGQDILEVTQESLRKNISMVPQDTTLFHRTLAENISYGKPGATQEEIEAASQLSHCNEFIKQLPYGFETYVGERGVKLSGGERQRVSMARAILKDAPILILDEATSSLDSHSEMLIQDALTNLMKGKTAIVIAHRLSTIQKMDRIIVIDEGKIIEEGNHNDLVNKKDSLYYKLWSLQAGGFLADEKENGEDPKEDDDEVSDEDKESEKKGVKFVNF